VDWHFAPGSGGREGLTASAVTIFQGDRLSGTVREIIQNSLDAGSGERVAVGISLSLQPRRSMPGVVALVPFLENAYSEVLFMHGLDGEKVVRGASQELPEDVSFYLKAIEIAKAEEIMVLGFHDWGTTGLGGPVQEEPRQRPGSWLALVRGQGVNMKSEADSLGSFGQGSKAPVSLSGLRTLFYLSRVEINGQATDRFIGKTLLSSMWLEDGSSSEKYLSGATGFFASTSKIDPVEDADIPPWALESRRKYTDSIGTTVYVPAPYMEGEVEDFERQILYAVLLNFFFAISDGRLEIYLPNGTVLNQANLRERTRDSGIFADVSADREKLETLKTLYFARDRFVGKRISETFGEFSFAIRTGDEVGERRVGIARKTGMLITRKPPHLQRFQGLGNFDLFVCVTDVRGSSVLRAAENPQHDDFQFGRISDAGKKQRYESDYRAFAAEIRSLIREFAELESTGRMAIADLSSLLGTPNEDQGGDHRVEFPNRLKVVSKKKRSKHEAIGVGTETLGSSGRGGQGKKVTSGESDGTGDGEGSGAGHRGGRLRQATEPLLEIGERNDVYHLFFSVQNPKNAVALTLFESGEMGRESLRFSLTSGGPLIGDIPKENWANVGTGKHRFRVDFFPTRAISSLEAWVSEGDDS